MPKVTLTWRQGWIWERYVAGKSMPAIAKEAGCSVANISQQLKLVKKKFPNPKDFDRIVKRKKTFQYEFIDEG